MSYTIAQNQSGALPLTFPFNSPITGDVTIALAGTCWSNAAQALGGVVVMLDNVQIGQVELFFNDAGLHITLPTQFFPVELDTGGPHKITLLPLTGNTVSDQNDFFSLWILD